MTERPSIADERAAHEAASRERRAELEAHLGAIPPAAGRRLIRVDVACTVLAAIVVTVAAVSEAPAADVAVVLMSSVFVLAGVVGFGVAMWRAAQRSREAELGLGGLFFLAASAPRPVAVRLNACLSVQVVVPILAAAIRPYSPVAFGTLTPLFGLAVNGLWSSHHGWFPPRSPSAVGVDR